MSQISFWAEPSFNDPPTAYAFGAQSGTFSPLNIQDSISLNTVNMGFGLSNAAGSATLSGSWGLYSLNGSTLSLGNSWSVTISFSSFSVSRWVNISVSTFSKTQNITPGTWFLMGLYSNSSNSWSVMGGGIPSNPTQAFPGGFIGGKMTASTSAIPTTVATSDLTTGASGGIGAITSQVIVISA